MFDWDRPVGAKLSTGYGQPVENTGIFVDKLWISCPAGAKVIHRL